MTDIDDGSSAPSDADDAVEADDATDAADVADAADAVDATDAADVADVGSPMSTNAGMLEQVAPIAIFLVLFRTVGLTAAVIASTAASIAIAFRRRRRGLPIGAWLPIITVYLLARAGITALADSDRIDLGVSSEAIYFGIGIATKMMIGIALAVTILVGRPFLVGVVPQLIPLSRRVVEHPTYRETLTTATWVAAAFEVITAGWDIWLYNNSGVTGFVVIRFLVGWVAGVVTISATFIYVDRRLRNVEGYPGLVEVLEHVGRTGAR